MLGVLLLRLDVRLVPYGCDWFQASQLAAALPDITSEVPLQYFMTPTTCIITDTLQSFTYTSNPENHIYTNKLKQLSKQLGLGLPWVEYLSLLAMLDSV